MVYNTTYHVPRDLICSLLSTGSTVHVEISVVVEFFCHVVEAHVIKLRQHLKRFTFVLSCG